MAPAYLCTKISFLPSRTLSLLIFVDHTHRGVGDRVYTHVHVRGVALSLRMRIQKRCIQKLKAFSVRWSQEIECRIDVGSTCLAGCHEKSVFLYFVECLVKAFIVLVVVRHRRMLREISDALRRCDTLAKMDRK